TFACVQPVLELQASVVQALLSSQLIAGPPLQVPAVQESFCVQTEPSLHTVPSGAGACAQPPTALHVSVVQGSPSSQLGAVPGRQVPDWQVSAPLHTSLSGQAVPFGAGELEQPPVALLQVSTVHGLPSSQGSAVPGLQAPDWQVSVPLQTFPSAQLVPLPSGTFTHPVEGRHPSNVHAFESSQERGVPGR